MTPDAWQLFLEQLQGLRGDSPLSPRLAAELRQTAHELANSPNPFAVIDELRDTLKAERLVPRRRPKEPTADDHGKARA